MPTVLEVLQSSTAYLQKRGVESPRLNAEHLLAHVLGKKRIELYLEFERPLDETELAPLRDFIKRRGQREPLQHLLGTVEFAGLILKCDKRALVPRTETEELVELLVQAALSAQPLAILDVGTGSGAIALALAHKFPNAAVHATDNSDDALALARENAARLELTSRVIFSKSDLLSSVAHVYDLIVANLPYVAEHERTSLSPEVLLDPDAAVFGGEVGDEIIRRLIDVAPKSLKPNGLLALEIGLGQDAALCEYLAARNFHEIETKTDFRNVKRFIFARHG